MTSAILGWALWLLPAHRGVTTPLVGGAHPYWGSPRVPGGLVPGGALSGEGQSGVLEWAKHPGLGLGLMGAG